MVQQYGGEQLLAQLQELYSKYKFMESQLVRSKAVLKGKFPDIQSALTMVEFLREKDTPLSVDYQLADSVYAKAEVQRTGSVALWLGVRDIQANVMLEYPYDEAEELLRRNLANATQALDSTTEDLRFLKDQITTCEVNIARVYNHLVQSKQTVRPTR